MITPLLKGVWLNFMGIKGIKFMATKMKKPMNLPGTAKKPQSPNSGMKKAPKGGKSMAKGATSKKSGGVC